jgi:hypothetical protein
MALGAAFGNTVSKNIGTMKFTQEQLEQINKWASIYLPISDMALMLDVPAEMLRDEIRNKHTEVSLAYHRGKAASRVKLHQQEMLLAQVGSPLAIENAHRNLLDMEDDESITTVANSSFFTLHSSFVHYALSCSTRCYHHGLLHS